MGRDKLPYRADLAEVESHLDPFQFVRIHRSTLVNLGSVASLENRFRGDFGIVMKNGQLLTLNAAYRANVEGALGQSL
jgi:two-component system LytT family response regulator